MDFGFFFVIFWGFFEGEGNFFLFTGFIFGKPNEGHTRRNGNACGFFENDVGVSRNIIIRQFSVT